MSKFVTAESLGKYKELQDLVNVTYFASKTEATQDKAGLMSASDKAKLDNLQIVTSTTDIGVGATLDSGTLYIVYE